MSARRKTVPPAHATPQDEEIQFFPCAFTWDDPQFGELSGFTVITGTDEDAAIKHFRSKHPHLTGATIRKP
jgi:hypothetical protein